MILKQKIAKLEEMQRAERRACRVQQAAGTARTVPLPAGAGFAERDVTAAAKEIIKRDKLNRKAAEGCIRQVMQDLDNGDRDYKKFLLYIAEAMDRITGGGDGYFRRLEYHLEQTERQDRTLPA